MEAVSNYTFVPLAQKNYVGINNKTIQSLLSKWGIYGNFVIQQFSFNESFQSYHKYLLIDAFFKNDIVGKELLTLQGRHWAKQGITSSIVETKPVPCSVLSMSFFNKLKDPKNGIVYKSGAICKKYDKEIDNFLVCDNLRGMLLDEECPEYKLYTKDEREEFIFRIFQMLVLGGALCQHEDTLDPYLDATKAIYKDLIRVEKQNNTDLSVNTLVLEVVAKDGRDQAYFPYKPFHIQNIGFVLVYNNTREITTFLHQYGEYCLSGNI